MRTTRQTFTHEQDYWQLRAFLREVQAANRGHLYSWHVARLDYWWARRAEFLPDVRLEDVVFLWWGEGGELAGALLPEHKGIGFLMVHPAFRTRELEDEMLATAEEHLSVEKEKGKRRIIVVADQHDDLRHEVLTARGYTKFEHPLAQEHQRRMALDGEIPAAHLAEEYTMRALWEDEIPARGLAAWKTTRDDEPFDEFVGWQWLLKVYTAPLYRRDLDIVAIGPGGDVASFCTLWYEDVTRSVFFEPVGTAQAHQRKGLAKAVMSEALRRAQAMGAVRAYVSSYTPAAHALYESLGFTTFDLCEPWEKMM